MGSMDALAHRVMRHKRRDILIKVASYLFSAALLLSTPLAGVATEAAFDVAEDPAPIEESAQAAQEAGEPTGAEDDQPGTTEAAQASPGMTVTEAGGDVYEYATDPSPQEAAAVEDAWAEAKGEPEETEDEAIPAPSVSVWTGVDGEPVVSVSGAPKGASLKLELAEGAGADEAALSAALPGVRCDIEHSDALGLHPAIWVDGAADGEYAFAGASAGAVELATLVSSDGSPLAQGRPEEEATAMLLAAAPGEQKWMELGGRAYYDNYLTFHFTVDGHSAQCANPMKRQPESGWYTVADPWSIDTVQGWSVGSRWDEVRYTMYYGPDGPGYEFGKEYIWPKTNWNGQPSSDEDIYVMQHILIADTAFSDGASALYGCSDEFIDWVRHNVTGFDPWGDVISHEAAGRKIAEGGPYGDWIPAPPDDFDVFMLSTGPTTQYIIGMDYDTTGSIELWKSSAQPEITEGNASYSLAGAVYEVRSADGTVVSTLVTDEEGHAHAEGIPAGSYTVVETVAPPGYARDETEYAQTVPAGDVLTIRHEDRPQVDPLVGIAQKVDAETGEALAVAGAQFTVGYYAGQYDASSLPASPTRSWVLETNGNGFAALGDGFKVSGDDFYLDDNGTPQLPLGTVTVQETKAPDGYLVNDELFLHSIAADGSGLPNVEVDMTSTVPERAVKGGVEIAKRDADTGRGEPQGDATLEGAVYTVYDTAGDAAATLTTGADGRAYSGLVLRAGEYTVRETAAPAGYRLNDSWSRSFEIADDGQVVRLDGADAPDERVVMVGVGVQKATDRAGTTPEGDVDLSGISFDVVNDSAAPVNVGGRDYGPGEVVATITTDAEGRAATTADALPYGTYRVVETSVPAGSGLAKSAGDVKVVAHEDGTVAWASDNPTNREAVGCGRAVKKLAGSGAAPQGDIADLSGVTFELYNRSANPVLVDGTWYGAGELIQTIATDEAGNATTPELPFGSYSMKEASAPAGIVCSGETRDFQIRADGETVDVEFTDEAVRGGIGLQKASSHTGREPEGDTSYEGIEFQVINASLHPVWVGGAKYEVGDVVATMVTDAAGKAATAADLLPWGTYTVHESNVPHDDGMLLTAADQTVQIREDLVVVPCAEDFVDEPMIGELDVTKYDLETLDALPLGSATLAGIEFQVVNASANMVVVNGTTYQVGEVVMTLVTDESGYATTGQCLPYGTYTVTETKVNRTYMPGDGHPVTKQVRGHGAVYSVDRQNNPDDLFANQVKRGDLSFVKVDEDDMGRMSGIPFLVTSKTTGEWHVVVTDPNGQADTSTGWNAHTSGTNGNDVAYDPETGAVDAGKLSDEAGVWFYGFVGDGRTEAVDDSLGALPYDTYEVKELSVPANEGRRLVTFETLVYKHGSTVDAGTVDDKASPSIATTLMTSDLYDPKTAYADAAVELVDHVVYTNVAKGDYTLRMELMDKATGEVVVDAEGNAVVAEAQVRVFSPNGEAEVPATVDLSALAGHDVVAFETLIDADGNTVAEHRDIEDGDQTIHVVPAPEIGTALADAQTGEHATVSGGETVLVDTVSYENLTPGTAYTVAGTLMDKSTGEPFADATGEPVTATTDFTPEAASGTVELPFTFDLTGIAGKTVVAFETVYRDGVEVAVHADIDDGDQTVAIPEIGTTLVDSETASHEVAAAGELTLVDTVAYKGLTPGATYTATGTLMDRETGTEVAGADGNAITATAEFTPEAAEGTVEVTFTFDASALGGRTLVAFETVERDGRVYAVHADLEDEAQTVTVPGIATTLADPATGEQDGPAAAETTLVDTVAYKGLEPGATYTVSGTLMDKETGGAVVDAEGNAITASAEFVPEASEGTVEIAFAFDGGALAGHTVVAFETLYHDGRELAVHADIEDVAQSHFLPEIGTTLTEKGSGAHDAAATSETVLVDTVAYKALLPGKTYTVVGTLMDRETGEPLTNTDGSPVSASAEFVAEGSEGSVEISFTFDASAMAGRFVVAFETLSRDGRELAVHADLEDEGQTVRFPAIATTLKDDVTRTHTGVATGHASLTDTVSYRGLTPGRTYTLTGFLLDKGGGARLLDADGAEICATAEFTPESADGEATVTFLFDASALAGTSVVAEEHVSLEGREVAVHADLEDADQTVAFCSIATTLTGPDGSHAVTGGGTVELVDTVAYTGLDRDAYTLTGELFFRDSGEPVTGADGAPVTAQASLVPESPDGTCQVVFEGLDAEALDGREVVAFETLTVDIGAGDEPHEIAWHRDPSDTDQTVSFGRPLIRTTLVEKESGRHEAPAEGALVLVDTVSYDGLTPGEEYELVGTLVDKATGKAVVSGGAEVTATTRFTPEETAGTATVAFEFDASRMGGTTVVAFETLSRDGVEVAVHADIEDRDQAVTVVGIRTTATDAADGDHEVPASGDVALVDRVEVTGVEPGATYTISTELADAATRETVATSATDVVPSRADTAFNVSAAVDATALAGRDLVFLETLSRDGRTVAEHRDYADVGQTVRVAPRIGTTLVERAGGTHEAAASGTVELVDTVEYRGLVPGSRYALEGALMVSEDRALAGADGKPVTARTEFTPAAADGTAEVAFTVDASALADGTRLVAFETLSDAKGRTAAEHRDISDAAQTVTFRAPQAPRRSTEVPTAAATNMPQTGQGLLWAALVAAGSTIVLAGMFYLRTGTPPTPRNLRVAASALVGSDDGAGEDDERQ